jgi:hypothetical protein
VAGSLRGCFAGYDGLKSMGCGGLWRFQVSEVGQRVGCGWRIRGFVGFWEFDELAVASCAWDESDCYGL